MMRIRSVVLAVGLFLPMMASAQPPGGSEADRAALSAVDAEFSAAAQKIGIAEAFVRYADPEATMLPPGENAVTGAGGIRAQFAGMPAATTLAWKPVKAEVAASGDLGYTLGTYEMRSTDAEGKPVVRYGKYCSVWKKQKDGSWKWVVDVGTLSPPPK